MSLSSYLRFGGVGGEAGSGAVATVELEFPLPNPMKGFPFESLFAGVSDVHTTSSTYMDWFLGEPPFQYAPKNEPGT